MDRLLMGERLGVQQLLTLGFGLLLTVAAVIGAVSVRTDWRMGQDNLLAARYAHRALMAERLIMLQQRQQATSRAFFLQPSADARRRFDEATRDFAATFAELSLTTTDARGLALLARARSACDAGTRELGLMFELEQHGNHAGVLEELTRSVSISKQIREALDGYRSYSVGQSEELEKKQQSAARQAIWGSSIAFGAGILLAIASGLMTIRTVGARVRRAHGAISAIANRDLSGEPIEVRTSDELGCALIAVNQMKDRLAQVVGGMRGIASQVSSSSIELAATAQDSASRADEQRSEAQRFADSLRELAAVVAQIAEHASSVSGAAARAAEAARNGDGAVAATVAKMEEIALESSAVGESIHELSRNSEQIGGAANLIRDIAGQTNLLALNAAIEAARAGELGRGFAVVASEVRRLAERTAAATREIDTMVTAVSERTADTLDKTRREQSRIAEGVELAAATRRSLSHIRSAVGDVEAMTTQIAAATTQQLSSTRELSHNLERILGTAAASAAAAQQSSLASVDLSKLSELIHHELSGFVLPADVVPA